LRSHLSLAQHPNSVIQDLSVYEDAEIFAQNLYDQKNIQDRDFKTYRELYETAVQFLPPPDLVIYLRASVPTLLNRINSRGRTYERTIAPEYLQNLNELYESWIEDFTLCPVLAVPADDLDYVAHSGHLRLVVSKVNDKLTGKEEVVFEADEVARAAED
jgi:deoxyadenosine/deoxycytidine kinase